MKSRRAARFLTFWPACRRLPGPFPCYHNLLWLSVGEILDIDCLRQLRCRRGQRCGEDKRVSSRPVGESLRPDCARPSPTAVLATWPWPPTSSGWLELRSLWLGRRAGRIRCRWQCVERPRRA
uniref:Uncharacterized protein n=1 Tax=Macrostomum lignano TaxID=282301 RepID=A0A1I8F4H2_9PLAT